MLLSMRAKRPTCSVEGCDKLVVLIRRLPDGVTGYFRDVCSKHHGERTAKKHGLNTMIEVCARNAGFDDTGRYKDSIHPARAHLKEFCENRDGRLGFVCTTTIAHRCMLDADHIDGNPSNNRKSNIQTLCGCCHRYKTLMNKDYATPGRKALGIYY